MPYEGYGLVRDKNGKPKFDDIDNIHPNFWAMLNKVEREDIIQQRKDKANGSNS